jgi:hypothetical protein
MANKHQNRNTRANCQALPAAAVPGVYLIQAAPLGLAELVLLKLIFASALLAGAVALWRWFSRDRFLTKAGRVAGVFVLSAKAGHELVLAALLVVAWVRG